MRIKSKFKDYYDYVAHSFGGGDPLCTYARDRLSPLDSGVKVDRAPGYLRLAPFARLYLNGASLKWCIVAGKYYAIYKSSYEQPYRLVDEEFIKNIRSDSSRYFRWYKEYEYLSYFIGNEQSHLIEISRKIGAPVFTIENAIQHREDNTWDLIIDSKVPILQDLGFPSIISAEQIYQDISYFLMNKIHPCPDMAPRSEITDKEKVMSHGFDMKQSFRHRL